MNEAEALDRAMALSCWQSPEAPEILGGGITNFNVRLTDQGKTYVVRIGQDIPVHGVMRFNELAISRAAHAAGIAPGVHHHEPGALVLEFIQAKTLGEADVAAPERLPSIIELVKRCHTSVPQHLTGPVLAFWVFHVIRDYAATLRRDGSTHVSKLSELLKTADKLEVAVGPVGLVLGHNDLLAANFLDDGNRLWLIDWEYGGFNSPLFDLGGLATNNGLTEAQERGMLTQYFESPPGDDLWRRYTAMKCASLMRETMWSMVSEIHSAIDFDYSAYTAENLQRLQSALKEFANS
ncbi:MAG: choline/ethanolamine kinase family protein [Pseudomonadota bacterium]